MRRQWSNLAGIGSLRGAHNAQNAACAIAACLALGLDLAAIQKGLASFPGLAHRMQQVGAQGQGAVRQRLESDQCRQRRQGAGELYAIFSGSPAASRRPAASTSLAEFFPRIAKAYLIGEAAADFASDARRQGARRDQRDAGGGGRRRRARCRGLGRQGAGGAAVAGLRLVRPIPELRSTRAGVRRFGAGDPGNSTALNRATINAS